MSARRTRVTDAFVLRVVDYRDADRIVTLLTADLGKVAALARGARRSRRRFAGSLEPYALVRVEVGLGHGEVGRLVSATVVRPFPRILTELRRMAYAGAATELVREVTPAREPDARVFHTVERFFELMDEVGQAREERLLAFQIRLLSLAGFAPALSTCGRCGKRAAEGQAALFDPASGSVVCRSCGGAPLKLSGGTRARMVAAVGSDWDSVDPEWPPGELADVRSAVSGLLEHHLGRRLRGGELVSQVEELVGGPDGPASGPRRSGP